MSPVRILGPNQDPAPVGGSAMRRRTSYLVLLRYLAVPAGVVGSALMVLQTSNAAFVATTANPTSNWTAGSVALVDDDTNTALFTATALKPGSTGTKCIVVSYNGTVASAVKMYGTSYAQTNALGANLDLVIDEGTGSATFAGSGPTSCTGFTLGANIYTGTVDGFATTKTAFASGVGSFAPTGSGQAKIFRVQYTLKAAAPNTVQSGTAAMGFTWEAQSS
jgi:hypothetical protein